MGAKCCCCCKTGRYENEWSSKKKVTFGKAGRRRVRVGDGEIQERFAVPEGTYRIKLLGREKSITINSSAFLPTGDVVLADSVNKKLKLYNCNFEFVTCMEFPTPVQHVCCSPNMPLLYATFPDRIRQIHVTGADMKRSGFIKIEGTCRSICVNRYDGKAITLNVEEDVGQVNLMTPGGNLQLEIDVDDTGYPVFIQPEQIIVTRNLNILVVDRGQQCLVGLTPEGEQLFQYHGVRQPTGLVCDEQNYIYLAGPKSIHQLNEKGELLKFFLSRAEIGLSPLSLSYNPERKVMLITGKGNKVVLFKMVDYGA